MEADRGRFKPLCRLRSYRRNICEDGPAGNWAVALVIGFSDCVIEDVRKAEELYSGHVKFGVNRAVLHFKCDHLVSIDKTKIPKWLPDYDICVHAGKVGGIKNNHPTVEFPWVDCWWPNLHTGGSSGWLAAKIAQRLGFGHIILCGMPIDGSKHLEKDPLNSGWSNPKQAQSCRKVIESEVYMKPYVRSMSGWTKEYFGAVDETMGCGNELYSEKQL